MNDYRQQMRDVRFSEDFNERTIAFLRNTQTEQEDKQMIFGRRMKIAVLTAALLLLCAAGAFAAVRLLSPGDVARTLGQADVAGLFDAQTDADISTIEDKGYLFTYHGMVAGEELWQIDGVETQKDRSYFVVSAGKADGSPIAEDAGFMFTPLIAGCEPYRVNLWSFGSSCQSFYADGRIYYLYDTQALALFADHGVFLAVLEKNIFPNAETLRLDENGAPVYADAYTGVRAIFRLPLDPAKADPEKAAALLERIISGGSDGREAADPAESPEDESGPF